MSGKSQCQEEKKGRAKEGFSLKVISEVGSDSHGCRGGSIQGSGDKTSQVPETGMYSLYLKKSMEAPVAGQNRSCYK